MHPENTEKGWQESAAKEETRWASSATEDISFSRRLPPQCPGCVFIDRAHDESQVRSVHSLAQ